MRRFINKLHEKPRAYRHAVALGLSLSITLVIFSVWLHSFIVTVSTTPAVANADKADNPLSLLKNNAAEAYQGIQALTAVKTEQATSSADVVQSNASATTTDEININQNNQ